MPGFFSVAVEYMLRKSDPMRKGLAVMDHGERVPQRECMCCGGDYPYKHLSEPMQAMQKCHMCMQGEFSVFQGLVAPYLCSAVALDVLLIHHAQRAWE